MLEATPTDLMPRARPAPADMARLLAHPLLAMVGPSLLERGLERCWLVPAPPGASIIRAGEYDDRFFAVLEGRCQVSVVRRGGDSSSVTAQHSTAGVAQPVAVLGSGDFMGELACMSPWPRSSTVVTLSDVVLVEVDAEVFGEWMDGSERFRATMEEAYRSRGLITMLRGLGAFASLGEQALAALAASATIRVYRKGEVVVAEGDEATELFLLRGGSVAVAKRANGVNRIVSYLRAGSCFGEMALIGGTPRTATVTAARHTELLCIPREAIEAALASSRQASTGLAEIARTRAEATRAVLDDEAFADRLQFLVEEGLLDGSDLLVVDLARCTRCGLCEAACAASHRAPLISLDGPRHGTLLLPTACRRCDDPLCLLRCPVDAIRRDPGGEVSFANHCIGCGACQLSCPYSTISLVPLSDAERAQSRRPDGFARTLTHRAAKCDLCVGIGRSPACVRNCPPAALRCVSAKDLVGAFARAT